MNPETQINLLRQAVEWRLISLLFACPYNGWHQELLALATEITDETLRAATQAAQQEAGEGLYHSTFGPGGPAAAREVSYRDWTQPGYLLSEIKSYHEAFAYPPEHPEIPDHVSAEADFVGYLRLKEAYALATEDYEKAALVQVAAQEFITKHLSNIAEPLSIGLASSGVTYLQLAGEALVSRVGPAPPDMRRTGLPILPDLADADFTCAPV